jgi:hypothetical protein
MGAMSGGSKVAASVGRAAIGAAPIPNSAAKPAATLVFAFSVTVQLVAIPLHAPLQPVSPQPKSGVAVSVTWVIGEKPALQVEPQSMPDGELVTLPPGLPTTETASA